MTPKTLKPGEYPCERENEGMCPHFARNEYSEPVCTQFRNSDGDPFDLSERDRVPLRCQPCLIKSPPAAQEKP
jgi:hypothetical protein